MGLVDLLKRMLIHEPCGSYLLDQRKGHVLLLRLSEGEPDDDTFAPLALWPMLLPEPA
jgi:hypothetical protein